MYLRIFKKYLNKSDTYYIYFICAGPLYSKEKASLSLPASKFTINLAPAYSTYSLPSISSYAQYFLYQASMNLTFSSSSP